MIETKLNTSGCLACIESDIEAEGVKWRYVKDGVWSVATKREEAICNKFAKMKERYNVLHIIRICIDVLLVNEYEKVNEGIKVRFPQVASKEKLDAMLKQYNLFADRKNDKYFVIRPFCPIFKKTKEKV